jgi:uncharacterized protein YutD
MIIETEHGEFTLIKNYKDAFDIVKFNEKYIDDLFDKYQYIVGDISASILRLRGFSEEDKGPQSYKKIPDYLNESCNMNTAYFILKRGAEVIEEELLEKVDATPYNEDKE